MLRLLYQQRWIEHVRTIAVAVTIGLAAFVLAAPAGCSSSPDGGAGSETTTSREDIAMAEGALTTEQKAPAFTLPNSEGDPVSLADYTGQWVVLYFYPRAGTPGCTRQACDFTEGLDQFNDLNAKILGVSPDMPEKLADFRDEYDLKITLLSDPEHRVMSQYGAWGRKKMYGKEVEGVIRSTVIIDPQGRIAHHWPSVRTKGHAEMVRAKLAELAG
jgi:peroxiredoxin Q/BCP